MPTFFFLAGIFHSFPIPQIILSKSFMLLEEFLYRCRLLFQLHQTITALQPNPQLFSSTFMIYQKIFFYYIFLSSPHNAYAWDLVTANAFLSMSCSYMRTIINFLCTFKILLFFPASYCHKAILIFFNAK